MPTTDTDPADVKRRLRRYGDFSEMNRTWNHCRSETTHQRLQANAEEWAQYHTLYQKARKDWAVVPYEELIRWCQQRSGYVIGDFGCGEAKLAEALSDRHTVHSFDHLAINENVVACDMAHVPLDDETLDVAIFSLSLRARISPTTSTRPIAPSSSTATCTSSSRLPVSPTAKALPRA